MHVILAKLRWVGLTLALTSCEPGSASGTPESDPKPSPPGAPSRTPTPIVEQAPPPAASHPSSSPPDVSKAGPCPSSMVLAGEVCIDRYEAHLQVRSRDGSLVPHPPHRRPAPDAEYVARSEPRVLPQAYINRTEAARACELAGKRLCSAREWFQACRGEPPTTYPYGPHFERARCNVGKPHLLSQLYGTNPRAWKYEEHFNNPFLAQMDGFLEPTAEFGECRSSFGAYDMVGNLHEWVADRVDGSLAHKLPLREEIRRRLRANTGKGVFMGGFFSTTSEHGRGCGFVTIAHEAGYHDYSTGFRCCRDP